MKTITRSISVLVCLILFASCSNRSTKSNTLIETSPVKENTKIIKNQNSTSNPIVVSSIIKDIVANLLYIDLNKVTSDANFINDLGADSLDAVELIMEFENQFDIHISDMDAERIQTVGQAIKYIESRLKEKNINLTQEQNEAELKLRNDVETRKNNTISATDLHNFFDENEVSAEIKFKGEKIYVEGVVESVGKDSKGMSVSLKAGDFMTTLLGYVNNGERDVIANLKRGDRITLYGFCDNFDWGIVTMEGCEVLENLK
jgi:acyl carrier protein